MGSAWRRIVQGRAHGTAHKGEELDSKGHGVAHADRLVQLHEGSPSRPARDQGFLYFRDLLQKHFHDFSVIFRDFP